MLPIIIKALIANENARKTTDMSTKMRKRLIIAKNLVLLNSRLSFIKEIDANSNENKEIYTED